MTAVTFDKIRTQSETHHALAVWLLICAGMVFAMAVIGAITRLTESGLSMVEWRPLIGVLPPLSEAEWQRVFDLYRATPEYRLHNAGMELAAFKGIFWWEWFHRLWGHLIAAAFAGPFLWFLARGRIPRAAVPGLAGLFVLGALQGVVGWFMVKSGLVDRPAVSHYRLALHLAMALLIHGLLLWTALNLLSPRGSNHAARLRPGPARALRRHAAAALVLAAVTAVWGAFVAGLDAGMIYNTWPLMGGRLVPGEAWAREPSWLNLFENEATVQFVHRWLAATTGLTVLAYWVRVRRTALLPFSLSSRTHRLAGTLAAAVLAQIALGILTLLFVVPVFLGAAHQAGALVLIGLLVWTVHDLTGHGLTGPAGTP